MTVLLRAFIAIAALTLAGHAMAATTTTKALYSGSGAGTSITVSTACPTLTQGSACGSASVDNTTNLYLDATVYLSIGISNGTPANSLAVNVYCAQSEDGTNWVGTSAASKDDYAGSNAAITLQSPTLYRSALSIPVPNGNLTVRAVIPSMADLCGSRVMPKKWGLIIENQSGETLNAMTAEYTGINYQNQ